MGLLETINDKLDRVLAALEAGGAPAGSTAPAAETAPKRQTAAEKKAAAEAAKPAFTAEQLRDKFLEVQGKFGDAAAKELIAACGYDKLAKLIADAPKWQASWDAAEAKLAEEPADEGDDNGGL